MPKKELLIIGGTGFIGQHLSINALELNYNVTLTYFNKNKKIIKNKKISYVYLDLNNINSIKKLISEKKYKYIINTSGYIDHSNDKKDIKKIINSHLLNIQELIMAIKQRNYNIEKFIQISTCDVYETSKSKLKETSNLSPKSIYAYSKLSAEFFLNTLFKIENFPITIFRVFITFGDYQKEDRLIPYVISNALKKKKIIINNGDLKKDFIHIKHISKLIIKSLEMNNTNGETINLGSGRPIKVKKLVNKICNLIGFNSVKYNNKKIKINSSSTVANISKAKKIFNWDAKVLFDEDLKDTINYYRIRK